MYTKNIPNKHVLSTYPISFLKTPSKKRVERFAVIVLVYFFLFAEYKIKIKKNK